MAEDHKKFMLNILEDLTKDDMSKLGTILNSKKIEGREIPSNKLQNLDEKKATLLFISHYEEPLKALEQSLCDIPRIDLVQKVRLKIETDEKNHEAQNNEKVALIKSCSGSNDRPLYTGKYTLVDLQDYATKNQDQLIMHLQNTLEPDQFNALKKELICRVLNKDFSFTAQKYYELFRNSELREFLKNNGKPKKIPMKLLEILFSKKKNNRKRKAQEQMQGEGNNLKKKQEEKIIPIRPMEHKSGNEDNNMIEQPCLDDKITLGTETEKVIPIRPIEHKSGNEDNNVIEESWLDEDSRMAFENWYEKKKYREKISFNYIGIHEHQEYPCFIAVDVLQFRLPDDQDYRILAILQDKRDFTNSQKLKKEAEFALQFNMAVLDVKLSEVISPNRCLSEITANKSFGESIFFLENIVSKIVLPVLALFKQVKLNAFKNANFKKQIFP
ncbi:uncharacterized protein LOC113422077 [Notechis scutatus]|uniref:Uncharacterized protein LOC113422077 n=1 Tax=Notechis scutatus TaxID=8663 RepID=A0A6J1V5N6_9SAUR|nr:uncharacterized protein LOC113422077 [Notechis scutatus]